MKEDIKTAWVSALRSGDFKQGKGALHHGDAFCCLGVLCELHSRATGHEWDPEVDSTNNRRYFDTGGLLPTEVEHWAELGNMDPRVRIDYETAYLSAHNDGHKDRLYPDNSVNPKTFTQIADAIEAQL